MRVLAVPRLNANDDTCRLVEWSRADGAEVDDQEVVAVVETSKAATDICSEAAGILQSAVRVGAQCRVGEVIGYVFATEEERQAFLREQEEKAAAADGPSGEPLVLTQPARRLSEEAGLSEAQLRSLGKQIVQRSDIEALLAAEATGSAAPLPARQQAIAKVVSHSHRTVPGAFVAVKVYCDALLRRLSDWNTEHGQAVGVPEAAIKILAGLRPVFPAFFGSLQDGERLLLPDGGTNIGVTVDVGTGLFVPVVTDVDSRTVSGIADRLLELRVTALRDAFRTEELTGGQLSVSLNTDPDVLFAVPIVLSPQVCMVSIPSVQTELVLDESTGSPDTGRVRQRTHLSVGLAYDHRVINGRDAVAFLTAFKAAVERPQEVPL